MVKIRLRRIGRTHKPVYRVVVADSRAPRDGTFIEVIGHYDPQTEPTTVKIDREKALLWLSRGAKPTETVAGLLTKAGISAGSTEL
ncbi:MAG: 30S ribosomal protein S16 [Dehalococcoidia bacterium]|jgi:small subunit ribosomal protein S16|nr:30S ribosomal protein S16 [Dehalococcoidia bacterium]